MMNFHFRRLKRASRHRVTCGLCERVFRACSVFTRFCKTCKQGELFRFHETLPHRIR